LRNRNLLRLVPVLLVIWTAGCAEPPTAAVDSAKGRLAGLEAEASVYAADAYASAEGAVDRLDAELETQAASFALFRNYELTTELVASVGAATDSVESAIAAEQDRLRGETNRVVGETEQAAASAEGSIAAIEPDDVPEEQTMMWDGDLAGVATSIAETRSLLSGEEFIDARRQADSALASANAVNMSIDAFVTALEEARQAELDRRAGGGITIPLAVMADGERLSAGDYMVRLGGDGPTPEGTAPRGRWVEFVRDDDVAGQALAVVIPDDEIDEVSAGGSPRNEARVNALKEGDYLRVWLHRDGVNYLVHLPPA